MTAPERFPINAGGRSEALALDPATREWGAWAVELMHGLRLLEAGAPPPLHVGVSMGGEPAVGVRWLPCERSVLVPRAGPAAC